MTLPLQSQLGAGPDRSVGAVVLLAGRTGRNGALDGLRRSPVDLPISERHRVLDLWLERLSEFRSAVGGERLVVKIAIDRDAPEPRLENLPDGLEVRVIRDRVAYRGTAGVARDATIGMAPDDLVLIAAASQLPLEPISSALRAIGRGNEGLSVSSVGSGSAGGLFLLRAERLSAVPEVGFVDLKEQAIPACAFGPLRIARRPEGTFLPIRTLPEYLEALRTLTAGLHAPIRSAYEETWASALSIVERGAHVAGDAVLQDTVVLAGGTVRSGAVVARCVIGPCGVVAEGQVVVDSVINT